MKCPIDNSDLIMTERAGVEVDYCPTCRGVWLDRGELDKIIERSGNAYAPIDKHSYKDKHEEKSKRRGGSFIGDVFGGFGD